MNKEKVEIESSEVLSETNRRNYEKIRITRVKYRIILIISLIFACISRGDVDEDGE